MRIKNYHDLLKLRTLEERFDYLKLGGKVGRSTWGSDRYFNQRFYHSPEWRRIRDIVIVRDDGCDLGIKEFPIGDKIIIHHMNPLTIQDLLKGNLDVLDPQYLICTSNLTHQAIHYGDEKLLPQIPIERISGDTKLW